MKINAFVDTHPQTNRQLFEKLGFDKGDHTFACGRDDDSVPIKPSCSIAESLGKTEDYLRSESVRLAKAKTEQS